MKYVLSFFLITAVGSVIADVPSRVIDGGRSYYGGEQVRAQYPLPCDSAEGSLLSANLTPQVVQFTASLVRKGTIQNSGAQIVRYRVSQWGLPYDWATVYESVPASSSKSVDLSGMSQLWAWSAAARRSSRCSRSTRRTAATTTCSRRTTSRSTSSIS